MKNNLFAIIRIIRQLMYILSPKERRQSIVVLLSMLATSCLELLGVSAIYPLLQVMVSPEDLKDKWYIGWVYGIFPDISYNNILLLFSLLIIIVFLLKNGLAIFFMYLQQRFASGFLRDASTQMLRKYMRRPYEFFVNTNSSIILRGINSDTSAVYQILLSFFQMVGECLTIALLSVFLITIDVVVAICALILAGLCFVFIVVVFKGRMKKTGHEARSALAAQSQCSYQAINGAKEIFVLDRREIFIKQYEQAADRTARCQLISGVIGACPDRILEGICLSGFIGIICVRLMISGDVSGFIPVLGSFAMGAFKILPSISKMSSRINNMVFYQSGLQNCYDNYREVDRIAEREKELGVEADFSDGSDSLEHSEQRISFTDTISIEDISWRYMNSQENVLDGLSMEIHKGESVALIGSSGAGKSTLADIIMGLLKPQSGTVWMDDHDIFLIPHSWHKQIGYVPQSVYLIDDTIRANIAFGLPKDMISDERVWSALEQAQFKAFVEDLPDGLDTLVGERGVKFSGGQRQRIALARALYENPEILVLDEATSALDNETEAAVMESIETLQGQKTLIIIAHRLTTIRNCDRIFEITDGVAKERTHEEVFA